MKKYISFLMILFLLMACSLQVPSTPMPSPSPIPPTSTSSPSSTPWIPTPTQPTQAPTLSVTFTPAASCVLTALVDSPVYQRPSAAADLFGTLAAGEKVHAVVKTADGFYGFDPGVAQAGNVGVFRNRWILKTYQVATEGDCASLPVIIGPIAGPCYAMVMNDATVFSEADTNSPESTSMHTGDYAMVIGSSPDWVKIDLNVSNLQIDTTGWIKLENIGYNGNCENLP